MPFTNKVPLVHLALLTIIYLAFISLGLPDGVLGVAWTAMQRDLNQPLAAVGLLTITLTVSSGLSTVVSGYVLNKLGTGPVVMISGFLTGLALLGFSFVPAFGWLLLLAVPLGLGAGAVDAGLNHFVAAHYSSRHMNWLHGCWGIGATLGPFIMGAALAGAGWQSGYQTIASLQLALAVVLVWVSFQDLASLMRNHKSLRYMINPFNTVYALGRHGFGQAVQAQQVLQPIGEDSHLALPASDPASAPLILLVVGETARAANFGLGGYARDTTPELRQLQKDGDLVYFSQVSSCGTNTQTSLPCMFSHLGRKGYVGNDARYENVLDVMQRAGLAVLWLDNQAGCKGVCDRVPHADTQALKSPALCQGGDCLDESLLQILPEQLARLDPAKTARGTVVVLHQMGSHGPAYYKRSAPAVKAFTPECTSHALQDCLPEQITNAYDNSLRGTDHFLAQTIQWLQAQATERPTALVYVSDHGESLGEKGLYLHGMPYALAPQEQTHVPMLMWFSKGMQQTLDLGMGCAQAQADKPWSHDNLFHTLLGLSGVQTQMAQTGLDTLSTCTRKSS